jgi:hypothetical protein
MKVRGAERDGATRGVKVLRAARAHGVEGPPVDGRRVWDAVIEVEPHHVGLEQFRHPADVVGVRMGGDDEIDGVDVKSREQCSDPGRAGVDDRRVAALLDDGGVALADVEEVDFELLAGERAADEG